MSLETPLHKVEGLGSAHSGVTHFWRQRVTAAALVPLSIWFGGAYLAASLTPGMSAIQFQRQLGLSRYETAFQILHKLRAGMVRPDRDLIGGTLGEHVEIDETYVGGTTRGQGRGVHHQSLVIAAVEVRNRKPKKGQNSGGADAMRVVSSSFI